MSDPAPVDLVFLWHHHQPDYRSPRDGRSLLPWVRLHASKDYLDMVERLRRFPRVRATFNFVPSLLDQLDAAAAGAPDALFDLLALDVAALEPEQRAEVAYRCAMAPRHALERWPGYRGLVERVRRAGAGRGSELGDEELVALETGFLLSWIDPVDFGEPEAARAIASLGRPRAQHRDDLIALHRRLLERVLPAHRELAAEGRIELSESPYYHPILPLLVNVASARRAQPDLPLPAEPFAAPADAAEQIARAIVRHERAFGVRPAGMWPSEGSVSPEVVELAARHGIHWMASDEGVLWASLGSGATRREAVYRPWRYVTPAGAVALLFRDHELSDRIGFVYQNWRAEDAVGDFIARLRRIGREHAGARPPVVSVILDGENCWEQYPDDGGPFLDRLYAALESAEDIRTRTPSEIVAEWTDAPALDRLHSGSWIHADFHIWAGHPEKNRAWDLLARSRRNLVEAGDATRHPEAWESLFAAEGSDWFWWFGEDHYTPDKGVFDRLFREHLQGMHEKAGLPVPGWLQVPIAATSAARRRGVEPVGLVTPVIDGRNTNFYEWKGAGHYRLDNGGSAMHRGPSAATDLWFGFDLEHVYLRLDFARGAALADHGLVVEILMPEDRELRIASLAPGEPRVERADGNAVPGARCRIESVLELGVPFAVLGLAAGVEVEMMLHLEKDGQRVESFPNDQLLKFRVPDEAFEASMWSA